MDTLKGKRVLITGGSSGIGTEISQIFAKSGAKLGIHFFNDEKGAKVLQDELSKMTEVKIYKEDFSKEKIDIVDRFIKDFGGIDILVNNAGVMANKSFHEIDAKEFDFVFDTNCRAPFLISSKAFEQMKQQKFGRIVNISSFTVKFGMGRNHSIQYAASKAALETLTTGLSRIGAEYNITANTIRPGIVNTKMQQERENLKERIDMIPLGRMAEPKEIAEMVLYLCSEEGNFITGQTISISGGE